MWICTPFGILMPALRPADHVDPGDPRTLQVRTRERAYLDTFRERYCPEMGESIHFPEHDYPWKAYVTPVDLATAVGRMTLDIDYEKFKPQTSGPHGLKDQKLGDRLHGCYNSMWSTQLKFGDGTSSYDKLDKPDPKRCERMGHWWPKGKNQCVDCKQHRPSGLKGSGVSDPKTGRAWTQSPKDDWPDPPQAGGWGDTPADERPCMDCGGGYWQPVTPEGDRTWIGHDDLCLFDDLCPECGNEPHVAGCPLDAHNTV